MLHHQQWSSGATTSTSSSSLLSTRCLTECSRQITLVGAPVPSAAHSRSLVAPHASLVARVASLATVDLRAKLERHRSGEDSCITIERRWERRRNLYGDFSMVDSTSVRQAARPPTSPGSKGGCMAIAPYLRMVVW
jgi:hypothetical protein